MKTLFLDALKCSNPSRPPVWLMRQAGRYLPEYRKIREKHSFVEMCHTPDIAAEVTLLPIKRFGMDAAILFSDILVVPEALGVGLHFEEGKGPVIENPVRNAEDVDALPSIDAREAFAFVSKAIAAVKPELEVPLIGFSGAPFTVASYMIEGGSSRDLKKTKQWMLRDPEGFHRLLDRIADVTIEYLQLQADSGVNAIQIFDSWANVLGHPQFMEFSLRYLKKMVSGLNRPDVPVILFCRGSSVFARDLVSARPQGIGLDWNVDLSQVRSFVPDSIAIQGNLDPDILYAPLPVVKKEVEKMVAAMREDRGYIFNLGHGVKPDFPVEAVKMLVDTIKDAG